MSSTRRSRAFAVAVTSALLATAVCTGSARGDVGTPTAAPPAAPTPPAPRSPLIFGTAAPTKANLLTQEAAAGRELVAVRIYRLWGQQLFGPDQIWERDTYHTLFLSIKPRRPDGTTIPWADIAAAQPGSPLYADMQSIATQIKAFGARVFLTFSHEPDASGGTNLGTGSQFVAAFRNFVTVMRDEQVGNMVPTAIFTGFGFTRTDSRNIANFYPGDDYNWGSCGGTWRSLAQAVEGARQWGLQHPTIPLMLTEYGSVEDPNDPSRKAQWLTDAGNLLTQPGYEQFAGVFAWGAYNNNTNCPFGYNTSAAATSAWAAVGHLPAYSAWE
jgi:hypothetical protein